MMIAGSRSWPGHMVWMPSKHWRQSCGRQRFRPPLDRPPLRLYLTVGSDDPCKRSGTAAMRTRRRCGSRPFLITNLKPLSFDSAKAEVLGRPEAELARRCLNISTRSASPSCTSSADARTEQVANTIPCDLRQRRPDRRKHAVVLEAVKVRPGNGAARGKAGATANLDSSYIRPHLPLKTPRLCLRDARFLVTLRDKLLRIVGHR